MCFGSKDNIQGDDLAAPRPASYAPQQPTYASTPAKSSVPVSPLSPSSPAYAQPPPQERQQPLMAELAAPGPAAELDSSAVAPPPGPPPSHARNQHEDVAPPPGPPPSHSRDQHDDIAPPPGPPPSHNRNQHDDIAPPPGPPPSHNRGHEDVAPPPGPPSFYLRTEEAAFTPRPSSAHEYAPPPGPPPAHDFAPPPSPPPKQAAKEHDWETMVPDTSLFPPPPDIFSGWDRSPATNATEAEAEAGERWCAAHPLSPPLTFEPAVLEGRKVGNVRLMIPDGTGVYRGTLDWVGRGVWKGKTDRKGGDSCLIGFPPLYAVRRDSPLMDGRGKRTVYYEVRLGNDNEKSEIGFAVGYAALPYPGFRMPGWHRGSLAVHADDGHKYINDRWGGKDFTEPMKRGETYGLGLVFTAREGGRMETEVFYTRQGREVGRWNLHEETDAEQDLPVTGLEGYHDMSCAVGTFGDVSFEVIFDPAKWLYKGVVV